MTKLTLLCIFLFSLGAWADVRAQRIDLKVRDASFDQVLQELRKQTGYAFIYQERLLQQARKVTADINSTELLDALPQLFRDQPFDYHIEGKVITLSLRPNSVPERPETSDISATNMVLAYTEVRGRVVDTLGQPLVGATVRVLDASGRRTALQTSTDGNGDFFLKVVPQDGRLQISYVGYITQEVRIADRIGTILLVPNPSKLAEIEINAGYYQVKDRERTGTISRVTSAEISRQPVTNPLAALIGRMPGVNVVQSTGIPGGGISVEIRGRNTISGSTQPLYIIDGVPFSNEGMGSSSVGFILGLSGPSTGISQFGLSPMVGIDAADIETIDILKDADATAIYGSRGANGVVLITTKRYRKNESQFNLKYSQGFGKMVNRFDLLNTEQYLELRNEAYSNQGLPIPSNAYDVNGTWDPNRYTDWQEELVGGTAIQNNLHATVQGGSELTNFILSGGTFRETLVFPGDYANKKYSIRSVVNHSSRDGRFQASANFALGVDNNDFPGVDLNYFAIRLAPNAPALYDADGNLNWENSTWENPMAQLEQQYRSKFENLSVNLHLAQELHTGLSLSVRGGVNYGWMNEDRTNPSTLVNPIYGIGPESSSVALSSTKRGNWIIEPQITYTRKWNSGLALNTLIGTTFQASSNQFLQQSAFGFTSNALIYDIKSASYHFIDNNTESQYRYSAIYGRFNLSWFDRYYINLTGRRDGSSRFGPGNQFANFGAVGIAWIFSDEDFIQNHLSFLSYGKLRGSYGLTGSDNIGDYKYLDTYASSSMVYEDKIGLAPTGLFNPNFAWETNSKLEGSLELGFLDSRLNVIGNYYINRSSNQLVGTPLPATTGFNSIHANLDATVQNTGFELELNSRNWKSGKFSWNSGFSLTVAKNKLLSFPNLETSTYANQYVIGHPLNISKRYNFLGVDSETGLFRYEDVDGDGRYTVTDRQTIIHQDPKFYGGLNNSFSIGDFQLDIFLQFVKQKGRLFWQNFSVLPGMPFNSPKYLMDRWEKPGDVAYVQRMATTSDPAALSAFSPFSSSSATIGDASFIRLKNVNVSYNLPTAWMKGISASAFVQGQNLWTMTNFRGADPGTTTSFNATISPLRMWTLGIQLNF